MRPEEKFNALRSKLMDASAAYQAFRSAVEFRHGSVAFATQGERTKLDKLEARQSRANDAFFAFLDVLSPRDWHRGVPQRWVWECLTYEDAIRPLNEKLSVVPPCSYGSTVPIS